MNPNPNTGDCKALAGFHDVCCSTVMWAAFAATGILLILSMSCNILCCTRNYRKDPTSRFLPRLRRSFSFKSKGVEDSPVYGNISYIYNERESQSDGHGPRTGAKGLTPGHLCYAKLELPSSREQGARSPALTPYSETLPMLKISRAGGAAKPHRHRGTPGEGSLCRTVPQFPDSATLENADLYSSVRAGSPGGRTDHQQYANKATLSI
ncbi:uncharacterized protein LOC132809070 [Hemiscyllium ocellatum]|uniref:uncharacterized protein LOC132809070 n=1 Tax=Hemiscyllium ocellatum TaxID=170820 RepID=UPI0029676257|nr:uncharacterized protein LOC132809070 [Hemiscyllium ocellatum]XP_060678449.1 uncharacterized protein LOC132809070 [Hemiscyllium ocellatum]